jgi:biopolymer transport protein ExbB
MRASCPPSRRLRFVHLVVATISAAVLSSASASAQNAATPAAAKPPAPAASTPDTKAVDATQAKFDRARAEVDQRLRAALDELAKVRERIAGEKIPISREIATLSDEVLSLRRAHEQIMQVRDSRSIDLTSLRAQVESLGEQENFVNSRLNEFVRDFEGRLDISELPLYQERTARAKLAENNANLDAEQKRAAQIDVVAAALDRVALQLGGQMFAGEALGPDGVLTKGTFIALGPTVFYANSDGSLAGLVETRLNAADPVVVPLPGSFADGIAALAQNQPGALPLDATLGKALKMEKASKSLLQTIDDGGAVGYVIVGLGLSALLLTVFKTREILGFEVARPEQVDGILEELKRGSRAGAAKRAAEVSGVAGQMLTVGVEHVDEKRGVLEELMFEKILTARPTLERFLPFLAITAAASPLLGLLGTVVGMIQTFQLITLFGTGDAKSLSSGISVALITTAQGLIVAIPVLILHGMLSRMAKHKLGLLEQLAVAFVNGATAIRHRTRTHDLAANTSAESDD